MGLYAPTRNGCEQFCGCNGAGTLIISLCIPCKGRTHVLRETMPSIIAAANFSAPCEIVVVDYDSQDGLKEYVDEIAASNMLCGNYIVYAKLENKRYYNSAHARNLCVMASSGEYIIQLSTEATPTLEFISYIRSRIWEEHPVWMCENSHTKWIYGDYVGRFIVCRRDEFIAAGGYDERFSVYAPEDKDICLRLHRRGGKFEPFSSSLIGEIRTPDEEKIKYYDTTGYNHKFMVRREMADRMKPIYDENIRSGVLVANPDGWGKWS